MSRRAARGQVRGRRPNAAFDSTKQPDRYAPTVAATSPPGAVVFDTKPIPFAVRQPVDKLGDSDKLGLRIAIWFGWDDADALHDHLVVKGAPMVFAPKDGPLGRYFAFRDPFGYTITPHTVARF